MSVHTLRRHITAAADGIQGLEECDPKHKIFLAYRHDLWREQQDREIAQRNAAGAHDALVAKLRAALYEDEEEHTVICRRLRAVLASAVHAHPDGSGRAA